MRPYSAVDLPDGFGIPGGERDMIVGRCDVCGHVRGAVRPSGAPGVMICDLCAAAEAEGRAVPDLQDMEREAMNEAANGYKKAWW